MDSASRAQILKVHSIGPTVVQWLAAADYKTLADFASETPESIAFRVEIATGVSANKNALNAYRNLIAAAKSSDY